MISHARKPCKVQRVESNSNFDEDVCLGISNMNYSLRSHPVNLRGRNAATHR